MSTLHERVYRFVSDAFIADRAIDPEEAAASLQKSFPDIAQAELADTVLRAANGIGARLKKISA